MLPSFVCMYIQDLILHSMQQWDVLDLAEYPYIEGYEEEKEPEVLIPPAKGKGDAEQSRLAG